MGIFNLIKNILIKILDLILLMFSMCICMSASVIMLPYVLVVSRIRIKSESKVETLFLLCEGATYETTKAKGTLDLLHTLICGGYFQKMYAVNFPALKNATIYVFGSLDMIEIA
ncbi:MAG TPA: hypothetical protein ENH41_03760, partial [Candidatus Omnitrophica bacterium]|nr:hypothetical protein [Candidatus Omnitrophota bacterium]